MAFSIKLLGNIFNVHIHKHSKLSKFKMQSNDQIRNNGV